MTVWKFPVNSKCQVNLRDVPGVSHWTLQTYSPPLSASSALDGINKLPCSLASGHVWSMGRPRGRMEGRRRVRLKYLFPQSFPWCQVIVGSLHLLTKPSQELCLSLGSLNCFFPFPLQAQQWYWLPTDAHPRVVILTCSFLTPALSKWSPF